VLNRAALSVPRHASPPRAPHAGMTSAGSGAPSKSGGAVCLDASKSARLGLGCRQPPLRSPFACGDGDLPLPNTVKEVIVPSQPRSIWRMSAKTAERWSLGSLREKLVKIGAKVVSHGRYVTFKWPRSRYRRRCLSISCRSSPNYGDRPSQHEEAQAQNAPRQGDGYASMQAKWRGSAIRCRPRPPHIVSCLRRQPFTVTEAG